VMIVAPPGSPITSIAQAAGPQRRRGRRRNQSRDRGGAEEGI
jgi:hypothetical protein